jgi:hypothetical protein
MKKKIFHRTIQEIISFIYLYMETFFTDMDILSLQISMKLCPVGQYLIRVHEIAYGFDGPSENNVSPQ